MRRHSLYLGLLMLLTLSATASDLAREQRLAEQIIDAILEGEAVWLEAEGKRFLAIHTPAATPKTLGSVILLHGMGAHPDWVDVIHPLRVGLPEAGWETLSIQLPVAASDAGFNDYLRLIPEAGPRLQAAVDYLSTKPGNKLYLVGHSLGARMGLMFLAGDAPDEVQAFVSVGLSAPRQDDNDPVLDALSRIRIPMLDLYGSRDLESVTQSAKLRRLAAARSGRSDYRQESVAGADHFFRGLDASLVRRVGSWLKGLATGMPAPSQDPASPSASAP